MSWNYISDTRDSITASKLKLAWENKLCYKAVYIDTPDDVAQKYEDEKVSYFNFWTMAHQFLEQYNSWSMTLQELVDNFLDEYNITNMYQKKELVDKIVEADIEKNWPWRDDVDIAARKKELTKTKVTLDDLRKIRYWAEKYAHISKKKKITQAEARDLILWDSWDVRIADSILKVAVMNKERDMWWLYSCEKRIEVSYKDKKLSAKPDRMIFYSKKNPDQRITVEEMDDAMEWMTLEERRALAEEQELVCMIRDYKTAQDPRKIWYEIKELWDTSTWYVFSMSFYYLIVRAKYGIKSEVCLDVIKSKKPFINYTHYIPTAVMEAKLNGIISILDEIVKAEETGDRWEVTIMDVFASPRIAQVYSLIAPYMGTSRVVEDLHFW